jgi:hypothetical protein
MGFAISPIGSASCSARATGVALNCTTPRARRSSASVLLIIAAVAALFLKAKFVLTREHVTEIVEPIDE